VARNLNNFLEIDKVGIKAWHHSVTKVFSLELNHLQFLTQNFKFAFQQSSMFCVKTESRVWLMQIK